MPANLKFMWSCLVGVFLIPFMSNVHALDTTRVCAIGSSSRTTCVVQLATIAKEVGIPVLGYNAPRTDNWFTALNDTQQVNIIKNGLNGRKWHYVIIMPNGLQYEDGYDKFFKDGLALVQVVLEGGAVPVIWMRRGNADLAGPQTYLYDEPNERWFPNFQDTINEWCFTLAESLNVLLPGSPVVLLPDCVGAVELMRRGIRVHADETHPTEWEDYLVTSMMASLLFQIKPFQRVYNPTTLSTVNERHLIHQLAWNAVLIDRMKPLLPEYAVPFVRATSLGLDKSMVSLEQYLSTSIDVNLTFSDDSVESHSKNAVFYSLKPSIASVDFYGNVTAKAVGTAKIGVWREGLRDTLVFNVVPSTAILDSIAFSPRTFSGYLEQGQSFSVLSHFHKNGQVFSIPINSSVEWISRQPDAFLIRDGLLERVSGEGGSMTLVAKKDGLLDSITFQMARKLTVLKRINFQGTDTVYHPFWATYDRGRLYDSTRGYGWDKVPYSGNLYTGTNAMDFYNELFLTATSVTPGGWAKNEEGMFRINVPDGDYIIKTCIGNLSKNLSYVRIANPYITDTLNKVVTTVLGQKSYSIDTLPIHTGKGIELYIRGAIVYLVLISKEGVNIDSVAYDTKTALYGSLNTGEENGAVSSNVNGVNFLTAVPNPFNPHITISFNPMQTIKALSVFDASGKRVVDLLPLVRMGKVSWRSDGPSGVYFIKAETRHGVLTKRIVLLH